MGRSIPEYRAEHNRSAVSFQPPSPPAIDNRYYHQGRVSVSRATTPRLNRPETNRLSITTSLNSEPASPTDSIVPFYYDYSESFYGRQVLLPPPAEHPTIEEGIFEAGTTSTTPGLSVPAAQSPFGIQHGSKFSPTEPPTKHNRCLSDHPSHHSRRVSSKSNRSLHVPSHQTIDEEDHQEPELETSHDKNQAASKDVIRAVDRAEIPLGRNSTNSLRNWPSPSSSTFFTNASRSPRNLSDLAARAHSPEGEGTPIGSIDAVTQQEEGSERKTHLHDPQIRGTSESYQLPNLRFRPLSIHIDATSRPLTSPVTKVQVTPEIVCPRPERPTSSQSRKRFSKILDVDQEQDIVNCYMPSLKDNTHFVERLERVDEANPLDTPSDRSPEVVSASKKFAQSNLHSAGPGSSRDRWSGVTSHDMSTVESLLDRHIECLGLRSGDCDASDSSALNDSGNDSRQVAELDTSRSLSGDASRFQELQLESIDQHRPTSLSTTGQQRLMPCRLFADTAHNKSPVFPLASSESHSRFTLSWPDEKSRPSCGWLQLPSDSHIDPRAAQASRQTLLSGDYTDVESGPTIKKFKVRKHLSRSLTPEWSFRNTPGNISTATDTTESDNKITPCMVDGSQVNRTESQKRRKLKIHLRTRDPTIKISASSEWQSTDEQVSLNVLELHRLGLTRAPISAVDGFAELSGVSTDASQQSLNSTLRSPCQKSPDTWSSIVAAMPMPARKLAGLKKENSVRTVRSQRSIIDPVNTSRVSSQSHIKEVKAHTSVPQLDHPDLGPSIRASQFDLSAVYRVASPKRKQSSFSEPADLLLCSPARKTRRSMRARGKLLSFRNKMPSSVKSFTFSPPPSCVDQQYTFSQRCRVERPDSYFDQPSLPETIAMSDFAYRKHKLVGRLKEWCRRRCIQARPYITKPVKRRSVPPGGFIV
ncbi:hypothetical protein LTR64_002241 [Lithohypha guttulata]|uniref:uncharacterized protein n=1 Tax=Lithohypha guttulata TaxID=1690604 RepID=UPI00315D88B9